MRYLGIDFGAKRVGLSFSDETNKLAFPHSVILNNDSIFDQILKVLKEKDITRIIIGESNNFEGKPNNIMKEIKEFKKELENITKLEVFFEPEFLTSFQAKRWQGQNDLHDASASAIILQSFLDSNKNK